jgi:pre-mRNA-splicing factor ISY1
MKVCPCSTILNYSLIRPIAWEEACRNARGTLGHPADGPIPDTPRTAPANDVDMAVDAAPDGEDKEARDMARAAAAAAASLIPFLSPTDLMPPKLPTREEMDGVLLALRKKALVDEYFG